MRLVETYYSKQAKGHYSPAVIHGQVVYISGIMPIDYENGENQPKGSLIEQIKTAFKNLSYVLEKSGSSPNRVLKTHIYIDDIKTWDIVNELYSEYFGDHKPARTIIPTCKLHFGALIEIDAEAFI